MNSQIYSSPTPQQLMAEEARKRRQAEYKAGKWPPAGRPWRAVMLLPSQVTAEAFRGETWHAILQELRLIQAKAQAVVNDTSLPVPQRDEAVGVVKTIEGLLQLEVVVKQFHQDMQES